MATVPSSPDTRKDVGSCRSQIRASTSDRSAHLTDPEPEERRSDRYTSLSNPPLAMTWDSVGFHVTAWTLSSW